MLRVEKAGRERGGGGEEKTQKGFSFRDVASVERSLLTRWVGPALPCVDVPALLTPELRACVRAGFGGGLVIAGGPCGRGADGSGVVWTAQQHELLLGQG